MFGPLVHAVKWLQAESCHISSLHRYCKEKIDQRENLSKLTAVISRVIFTCPGRAGPVFRLDPYNRSSLKTGLLWIASASVVGRKHTTVPLWGLPKTWQYRRDRKMTFLAQGTDGKTTVCVRRPLYGVPLGRVGARQGFEPVILRFVVQCYTTGLF